MERIGNPYLQDRMIIDAMGLLVEAGWAIRTDDGSGEVRHRAEWALNPKLNQAFPRQRKEIIKARQFQEDERRRIAGIERRIVPGYDQSWDDERMSA